MDSFELNKVLGALLGAIFVVFSVSLVADAIFAPHPPATQGFAIEVSEEVAGGPAEDVPSGPSALELIATADAAAGEAAFRRCTACHTAEEGGANRVGPNLWDIVNRPVAGVPGFAYSAGMQAFAEGGTVWDYEHLSGFLVNPRGYVPGTSMSFAGIRDPQEEANLIAYLRTLSNDPAPLPEVAPAEPETAAEPAEPTPETDATEAGPEPDAGTPAVPQTGQTEEAPAGQLAPQNAAPADAAPEQQAPAEDQQAPAEDQQAPAPAQAPILEEE